MESYLGGEGANRKWIVFPLWLLERVVQSIPHFSEFSAISQDLKPLLTL